MMTDEIDEMAGFFAPNAPLESLPDSAYADDRDIISAPRSNVLRMVRNGQGGAEFREMTDAEKEALPPLDFAFWEEVDFAALPRLQFVYSDFYARGYTSVTLAAPKVGKSMLAMAEAIDMATGRGFLTGYKREPLRVLYFNAEDDIDTLRKRAAALLTFYGIPQSEIVGRLVLVSGVGRSDFVLVSGQDPVINEPLFVRLERFCQEHLLDAAVFDPLQDLSRSPETNEVFRLLGQRLRLMASACQVALGLVHHTRKVAAGTTPNMDDMRGGSALRGTSRFNRVLVSMSEDEGVRAGVPNHRHFFRLGDIESNMAPPSSDVNRWYEKVSVVIPNGEHIGAVRPWTWPDAFAGVTPQDAARVRQLVAEREDDPPAENSRNKAWVGIIVAQVLGLDLEVDADKARARAIIKTWIASGILIVETVRSPRDGRDVKVVMAGPNDPLREDRD